MQRSATSSVPGPTRRGLLAGVALGSAHLAAPGSPAAASGPDRVPLHRQAARRGLAFGSSVATWQLDAGYRRLLAREAGVLLTEDDLLWHRLKPRPDAPLDFRRGDRLVDLAERHTNWSWAPTWSGTRASAPGGRPTISGGWTVERRGGC